MQEDYYAEKHYTCNFCDKYYCLDPDCHCLDGLEEEEQPPQEEK